jgi:hypothetical protein
VELAARRQGTLPIAGSAQSIAHTAASYTPRLDPGATNSFHLFVDGRIKSGQGGFKGGFGGLTGHAQPGMTTKEEAAMVRRKR